MTVKKNLLALQYDYLQRFNQAKAKAERIFPLHERERQLRLSLTDDARMLNQVVKLLQMPNINLMLKNIETQIQTTKITKYRNLLKEVQKKLANGLIDDVDKVGITELADPSQNLTWVERLRPKANIIITKNLQPIIPQILANKQRIILHVTCTGFGGTPLEPGVPPAPVQIMATKQLIQLGFPVGQIVLRLDPIIFVGNIKDVMLHDTVMQYFAEMGVKRCRYSFLDQYDFIKPRLAMIGITPERGFTYPKSTIQQHSQHLQEKWGSSFHLEACCEETQHKQACISQMDIDILKQNASITGADSKGLNNLQLIGCKGSRRLCSCPLNKFELMRAVPGQCSLNCSYCFWSKNKY